jgi:hypothetical protein
MVLPYEFQVQGEPHKSFAQYYMIIYQILQALGEVVESMEKLERETALR